MANISEVVNWNSSVYQWADGDVLDGGPESLEVLPVKQLANRALYQRLHNVTPWSPDLAAAFGYPLGSVVMHIGFSWRAKLANNVEPGSDPVRWERWGYSESELNDRLAALLPYGAPVACAATGPDGAADKSKLHKSATGEYWMWLGDAWMVIANRRALVNSIASNALPAGVPTAIVSITAPRDGRAVVRGILSALNASGGLTEMQAQVRRTRGGVQTLIADSVGTVMTTLLNQYSQARAYCVLDLQAGDIYHLIGTVSHAVAPSPLNASSIYIEYLQ